MPTCYAHHLAKGHCLLQRFILWASKVYMWPYWSGLSCLSSIHLWMDCSNIRRRSFSGSAFRSPDLHQQLFVSIQTSASSICQGTSTTVPGGASSSPAPKGFPPSGPPLAGHLDTPDDLSTTVCHTKFLNESSALLIHLSTLSPNVILLGDFNIHSKITSVHLTLKEFILTRPQ